MIYFPYLYEMNVPYSIRKYLYFAFLDETQDLRCLQLTDSYCNFIYGGEVKWL